MPNDTVREQRAALQYLRCEAERLRGERDAVREEMRRVAEAIEQYERGEGEVDNFLGYTIVDKDGNPSWGGDWCEDRGPIDDIVDNLNDSDDPRRPYRVVELRWVEIEEDGDVE